MSVADLRSSYERAALSEGDVAGDPLVQFDRWFQETLGGAVPEPNAMTLSTVGADGRPSSRIVLLKGYDRDGAADATGGSSPAPRGGLVWFTNYQSKKGIELAIHPHACLLFHWIALERQVRIEGCTERISAAESDRYFESRPLGSRIGAWASPQSQVVASRQVLEEEAAALALRFGQTVPRPPQWGGYRLIPDYFEFWQGRPSRLHDRLCYRRGTDGRWSMSRLAP